MGLSHSAYWASWLITALVIIIILSLNFMACGYIFSFDLFVKTPIPIIFVLFTTFGFSIALVAFFIATICPDVKNGYTVAYGFMLIAIIMQMFFT